jgi:hypothetical protein
MAAILTALRQASKMVEALMRSVRLWAWRDIVIVEAPSDLLKGRIEQSPSHLWNGVLIE